ncbi:MarR family winged helix-turn-helix transcriptional regulator [Oryzisolibacter sp. LB2S]|uniref:MarR family winged helix-turn-helix transcriptional regulator n=1 Tax=Alicycliphilus soli TaxID=3228789 RepID=UPI0034598DFB
MTALPPSTADLLDALHDLVHAYRTRMRTAAQRLGCTLQPGALRVLLFVGRQPLCTHKDLVGHTHADKALVARTLNELEQGGWLERLPHAQDRRSRALRLTPQGEALFVQLGAQRSALGRQMLQGSDGADQQRLLAQLRQMARNLEGPDAQGAPR